MLKCLLIIALFTIFSGCSTQQKTNSSEVSNNQHEIDEESLLEDDEVEIKENKKEPSKSFMDGYINRVVKERLPTNGANMLCSQEEYLDCFKQNKEECMADIQPFEMQCYESTEKEFNYLGRKNLKQYIEFYASCMATEHIRLHPSTAKQHQQCLLETPLNPYSLRSALVND